MEGNQVVAVIVGTIAGLIIGAVLLSILGFVLKLLWNSTLPDVLGAKRVTTWQAIKLLFIASILFGGHRAVESRFVQPDKPPKTAAAGADDPGLIDRATASLFRSGIERSDRLPKTGPM